MTTRVLTRCRVKINGEDYHAERVEIAMNAPDPVKVVYGWQNVSAAGLMAVALEGDRKSPAGEPARRKPRPGRNSLCSCGSGSKFKRCCGRTS